MGIRESDFKWLWHQALNLWSWTGISWIVALFAGGWGVAIGIGAFVPAYICLAMCLVLCALKWWHVTNMSNEHRRITAFIVGAVIIVGIAISFRIWSVRRRGQAEEDARKLEPLKQIPGLVAKADQIPGLRKQLEDLPGMQAKIDALTSDNKTAADAAAKKQALIEGLAQTVVEQQKAYAERAHKDSTTLSSNIMQYRDDTTSAVAKIIRPGRTLGDLRTTFVSALKQMAPHDIAITPARGSTEAITYTEELRAAFKEGGWTIVPTQKLVFMVQDGLGLRVMTKPLPGVADNSPIPANDLTAGQLAVGKAFASIKLTVTANPIENGDKGVTELYVGLQ